MKDRPALTSVLNSLGLYYSKDKKEPASAPTYQPTIKNLQDQVAYYLDNLTDGKINGNNISLKKLCDENAQLLPLIKALPAPKDITAANQEKVRQQLLELSDALITQQLIGVNPEETDELCLLCISEVSDAAVKKLAALPNLAYLQINGSALVALPPTFATLKLNNVYLQNNYFSERPAVLDHCINKNGKPTQCDLSLNPLKKALTPQNS